MNKRANLLFTRGIFFLLWVLHALPAAAQITIVEVTQQEFPAVYQTDRGGAIVMNWDSSIKSVRGLTLFGGFYSSAEFLISSDTNQQIDIDIIPSSSPGVQIAIREVYYQNKVYRKLPVTRLDNPGSGSSLFVGMEVSIDANVTSEDALAISYELIINER